MDMKEKDAQKTCNENTIFARGEMSSIKYYRLFP